MALELKELKETSLPLASKSLLSINNYIEVDIKIPVYDRSSAAPVTNC